MSHNCGHWRCRLRQQKPDRVVVRGINRHPVPISVIQGQKIVNFRGGIAQPVRAVACRAKGCEFKSRYSRQSILDFRF